MNRHFFTVTFFSFIICQATFANKPKQADPRITPQIQLEPNPNHEEFMSKKELVKAHIMAQRIAKQKRVAYQQLKIPNNIN